jgi:hypothetical protein
MLVPSFSSQKSSFSTSIFYMGFAIEKLIVALVFHWLFCFPLPVIISPVLQPHLSSGTGTVYPCEATVPTVTTATITNCHILKYSYYEIWQIGLLACINKIWNMFIFQVFILTQILLCTKIFLNFNHPDRFLMTCSILPDRWCDLFRK